MSDTSKINKDADSKAASANADTDAATSASSLGGTVAVVAEELEPTTNEKGKKEEEPLCLEYATPDAVPLHLRQMLSQHSETKISSVELLMLLIYLVALESGFVEDNAYVKKQEQLKPVPAVGCFHIYNVRLLSQQSPLRSRKSEDALFRFVLRTLLDASATEDPSTVATLQSHLMAVVLGDLLMVTLSPAPPSKEPGYSICLSIGRYVLNVQLEPLYKRFRKLDELSLQLRQKLFQPMRAQQLLTLKLYLHPSLLGLPDELYHEIFRYLNWRRQGRPARNPAIRITSLSQRHWTASALRAAQATTSMITISTNAFKLDYSGDSNNGPWEKQKQTPSNQLNSASDNVATKTNEQLQHDLLQQLQQQFQMAAVQQQRQLQHQHSHPPFQQQQQQLQQHQQQQQMQQQQHNQYATQTHSQRHPKLQHHLSLGGAPIYQQLQQQQQQQQQQLQAAATSAAPTAYHCQYSTPQHHYRNSNAATATTTTTAAAAATIRRRTLSHVARSYSVCATMTPATGSVTVAALQQKTSSNQQSANIATSSTSATSSSTAPHVASTKLSVAGHHKTGIMVAASRCRSPIMLCHSHSDGEFPMYRGECQ
ncbi:hypothetical protein ACLKA7_016124 [Drosophila subpalustris]